MRAAHTRYVQCLALACASVALLSLAGCKSFGPVGVDPSDRSFDGLNAVLNDLPSGRTLDVFLAHGMRADRTQTYADVIKQISSILQLREIKSTDISDGLLRPLVDNAPTVTLDGIPVFDAVNWDTYRPRVFIARFASRYGNKHVNFYGFQYWQALAYLKCRFVIAPDSRVVGPSDRTEFCAKAPYLAQPGVRLSSSSDFGNRWLKTEILEWGLADATIATSGYRAVLRQAVRDMLAIAVEESRTEEGIAADPGLATGKSELSRLAASGRTRFAFIAESLGSYVVHDALAQEVASPSDAEAEIDTMESDRRKRQLQRIAPVAVICGASQVHMFANQLALLRFSELQVDMPSAQSSTVFQSEHGIVEDGIQSRSHFFRGCPESVGSNGKSANAAQFAAQQVVAYHEPNDILTYYTSDRPGYVGASNANTINVVIPFTTQWIWGLLANPMTAHTGYPQQAAVMDMVVCGRRSGSRVSKCPDAQSANN